MKSIADERFVVETSKKHVTIPKGSKLNIPIVGIVDTNCDPDEINYIIPANDDAIRAVKLLTSKMADAIIEGKQGEESAEGMQPEEFLEEAEEAEETEETTETKEVTE